MADEAARASSLEGDIAARTDVYFNRTREVVRRFGDRRVTYAVFLRRPVIAAPRLMLEWIALAGEMRGTAFEIDAVHPEGSWIGAGEPIVYISGSFIELSDLETIMLQKARPRLRRRAQRLPDEPRAAAGRLPGDGGAPLRRRRDAGDDGLRRLRRQRGGQARGRHRLHRQRQRRHRALVRRDRAAAAPCRTALIGYAGSTVRAAEMFHETFPDEA